MDNIIPLAGAEAGDKIGPHVATRAIKVRHRQATAMLEVALALMDVKRYVEDGADGADLALVCEDLETLAKHLKVNAL